MDSNRLEERVGRLEKGLHVSRLINLTAGIVGLLFLATSLAGRSEDSERLRRLEIVDSKGKPRIVAEADPSPQILFKSEAGQDQIRLAIGGKEDVFPFDHGNVPHLTLETGQTSLRLSVSPAPQSDGLDERSLVESAVIQMQSSRQIGSELQNKQLIVLIAPDKASMSIVTFDPQDPAASIMDPGVRLFVDEEGEATTKIGGGQKK